MNTQLLKAIVSHPRNYDHILNAPGQYDAAVMLYTQHADELTAKAKKECERILIRSGKCVFNKIIEL